jgi:hypothetical protein
MDLSTKAGALRFAELRRAEMVGRWETLGRWEVNGFSFGGYVFATHEAVMPTEVPRDLRELKWPTGAKLPKVTALPLRLPRAALLMLRPEDATAFFAFCVQRYTEATRALGTLIMAESWLVQTAEGEDPHARERMAKNLEDEPDRQEILMMSLEHSAVGQRVWRARIHRDPDRLDPWQDDGSPVEMEGRLTGLAATRN